MDHLGEDHGSGLVAGDLVLRSSKLLFELRNPLRLLKLYYSANICRPVQPSNISLLAPTLAAGLE